MTPTLGRIVLFFESTSVPVRPAMVVAVHDDGTVDLAVFTPSIVGRSRVPLDDTDAPRDMTWSWPPRAGK